jgi:hypothetical protein
VARWAPTTERRCAPGTCTASTRGMTIHYHQEDPYVRKYYAERLRDLGGEIRMPDSLFEGPSEVGTYHLH